MRIEINNAKDTNKIKDLRKERNCTLRQIREKTRERKNERLDELVKDIDKTASDGGMFKAVKILNQNKFDNLKI